MYNMSRPTKEEVLEKEEKIRELLKQGKKQKEIVKEVRCSARMVSRVKNENKVPEDHIYYIESNYDSMESLMEDDQMATVVKASKKDIVEKDPEAVFRHKKVELYTDTDNIDTDKPSQENTDTVENTDTDKKGPLVEYSQIVFMLEIWKELEKKRYLKKVIRDKFLNTILDLNGRLY